MLDSDVKILHQEESRRYDDRLQAVVEMRVEFKVGTFGPFSMKIPMEQYTQYERDTRVNTFAATVRVV